MAKRDGEKGTVSVYLAAALAAFIMLTGLLIDFARVAAFRKQLELAVKSGVRSVMSAYDPVVRERYGLFVRGGDPAVDLFRQAVESHLRQGDAGGFRFIDGRWESGDVTESRPLADHGIFRRQVAEEMKYKAPIDLALDVASRFRGLRGAMREAAATVGTLESARKAYERRERALDEAARRQEAAGKALVSAWRDVVPEPPADGGPMSAGYPRAVGEAARMYADYAAKRAEDEARRARLAEWEARHKTQGEAQEPKPEPPQYEEITSAYERGMTALAERLREEAADLRTAVESAIREALPALEEAKAANEEIRRIAAEHSGERGPTGREAGAGTDFASASGVDGLPVENVRDLRMSVSELVLEDSFFSEYEEELRAQLGDALRAIGDAERFAGTAAAAPGSAGLGGALREQALALQRSYEDYRKRYDAPDGGIIRERRDALEAHRRRDGERKALEREAREQMKSAAGLLRSIGNWKVDGEQAERFLQAERAAEANLAWNRERNVQEPRRGPSDDPAEERDRALGAAVGWLDALDQAAEGMRDDLFFSEYVAGRFSRFDPSLLRRLMEGDTALLELSRQETEYILYGFREPAANLAAAYGEVFAFRLAVRTLEGLAENRSLGHPLVILAAALVYGVTQAAADMERLMAADSVTLSKYIHVETHYADYLRLFLLLHGDSAAALARVIALMELTTGIAADLAFTYASGEGTASLKLWFFPGIVKALGVTGGWGGQVAGNRYVAAYAADLGYQ
jgi:hypothetical protein